jgi:hypothetical protein
MLYCPICNATGKLTQQCEPRRLLEAETPRSGVSGALVIMSPTAIGALLALLTYVLPGLALVRREEWARAEPVELAAVASAGSVAWWAVGIWFIGFLRMPLSLFALGSLAGAGLFLLLARRTVLAGAFGAWRTSPGPALWALAFVVAVVGTRAVLALTRIAFSVGDMSAHAYMTELIVMHNGLPKTYRPFLPIGGFGSFPLGFHALAAVETLLTGIPTYRSTIHVLCFSLMALTFTLAALLRGLGVSRAGAALGAAGALMLARNPQFFEYSGTGPALLATALIFLVLRDGLRLGEACPPRFLARLGFLSAGTLLTHQLPVVSFLYVFPVAVALRLGGDRTAWMRLARNGIVSLAVAGSLATPFLTRIPHSVPPEARAWARMWFRTEAKGALLDQARVLQRLAVPGLSPLLGSQTWPFYVLVYLGALSAGLLGLGLAVRWLRQRGPATTLATALLGLNALMFTGAVTQTLPLWPSLYPTRIGIWLVPSLAIALAGLGSFALAHAGRRTLVAAGTVWLGLFAAEGLHLSAANRFGMFYYEPGTAEHALHIRIVANEAVGGAFWVATFNRENAPVDPDDLRAFAWIREHTPPGAVFATNYYDGGNLIPAVAHRGTINPHFNLAMFYQHELEEWRRHAPVDYIYVSSEEAPEYRRTYTAKALDQDPRVELVFRAGKARVYKLKQPQPLLAGSPFDFKKLSTSPGC